MCSVKAALPFMPNCRPPHAARCLLPLAVGDDHALVQLAPRLQKNLLQRGVAVHELQSVTLFRRVTRINLTSTPRQKSLTAQPKLSPGALAAAAARECISATVVLNDIETTDCSCSPANMNVMLHASSLVGGHAFMAANSGNTLSTRVCRILSLLSFDARPTSQISQTGHDGKKF